MLFRSRTSPDAAFEIALRVKRGLVDGAAPGGDPKDHVYLRGLHEVSDHLAGRPDDHELLLGGKVAIAWLPELRAMRAAVTWVAPALPPAPPAPAGWGGRAAPRH